ncbi:hypothetical protein CJ030_MR1G019083 [Morella rubra]|uniref:Uncharacterized protein n=1 Tax=Morella rubra TaxID=262757 RepID=A0A6A1WS41_9ROSI|nr:hypothetical protein CJ030_MR1G019083 [Morella rubra]
MASPGANDSAAIELHDQWAIDIIPSKHCCIYRVPTKLRKANKDAYTPLVVSIGPFHRQREEYEKMEIPKKRYKKFFCERTGTKQEDLTTFIKSRQQKIRHSYSEEFGTIEDEEFVEMVKLDAIFIIELFWRAILILWPSSCWAFRCPVRHQSGELPHLFLGLTVPVRHHSGKLPVSSLGPSGALSGITPATFWHLLLGFLAPRPTSLRQYPHFGNPLRPHSSYCLPLSNHIPAISGTEVTYRNLMALDQCHYPFKTRICNYIRLLDNLIIRGKDVDLLVDRKVIANGLGGSEAASELINTLCDRIVPYDHTDKDSGDGLSKKLNDYYENPWNRTMATMTSTYFSNFWRGTATVVGIIILCFAFWNFLRPFVL